MIRDWVTVDNLAKSLCKNEHDAVYLKALREIGEIIHGNPIAEGLAYSKRSANKIHEYIFINITRMMC